MPCEYVQIVKCLRLHQWLPGLCEVVRSGSPKFVNSVLQDEFSLACWIVPWQLDYKVSNVVMLRRGLRYILLVRPCPTFEGGQHFKCLAACNRLLLRVDRYSSMSNLGQQRDHPVWDAMSSVGSILSALLSSQV